MVAGPPPPPDGVPAPTPLPLRSNPWRIVAAALLAVVVILASLTVFWYVTKTGPFATIEPSTWALEATQVSDLQAHGLDGSGVRVCIVDTGVDLTHPELRSVHLAAWKDFTSAGRTEPYDDEGHGTAMTGIIFAQGLLHGVAPRADLIAAKAITASGSGTDGAIAGAIRFCRDPNGDGDPRDDGANVISLSLGGSNHPFLGSQTVLAVNNATGSGIYVVAAAGNDGQNDDGDVESPASEASVIAVGAVDRGGVIAPFSSIGSAYTPSPPRILRADPDRKPEVVAPGVEIAVPLSAGRYAYVSGTSPAAAFVSGIVALLLQDRPAYEWNAARLVAFKTALMESAEPETEQQTPHDAHYGYGLARAVAWDTALPP